MTICGIPEDTADFDTDDVWTALAETGKYKITCDFCEVNNFRNQLYIEAREEEVQLRIDVRGPSDSRPTLYISLREQV
jgi:hypothetical protein